MQTTTPLDPSDNTNSPPPLARVRDWYHKLPDKKRYLELVTAFLTIPVLLTVLISNVTNIQRQKNPDPAPTPEVPASTTPIPANPFSTPTATPTIGEATPTATPPAQCTPGIGPIDIAYPEEGSTVTRDPVCLDIPRASSNYCAVVWSYRINGSIWSDYTDREICMYGLTPGKKQLELRVKSIVSGEEKILKRNFTVEGSVTPTPATQSATLVGS